MKIETPPLSSFSHTSALFSPLGGRSRLVRCSVALASVVALGACAPADENSDTSQPSTSSSQTSMPSATGTTTGTGTTAPTTTTTSTDTTPDIVPPTEPPDAYTTVCSMCHGENGEGADLGPEIRHTPVEYGTWVTRNGRNFGEHPDYVVQMVPIGEEHVTNEELALTFAWLGNFPKPTTGPEIYADYCGHCHGADARSGAVGLDLTMYTATLTDAVRNGKPGDFSARTSYMPAFGPEVLTDADLQAIITHISSL